jgi:CRP/FNR family transcriptional regulator, cyclic AMP receptor protein
MKRTDAIAVLKLVPLFQGLSDRELRSVARDARVEQPYAPGESIVTEGSPAGSFFVIVQGRAKVIQGGKARKSLGPGAYFGEMSLFDRSPRAATVVAETQVKTLALSPQSFFEVLAENWTVTRKILIELSSRVRALDKEAL